MGEIGCYLSEKGAEARNSRIRSLSARYTESVAVSLSEKFPKLKANHISWLGFAATLGGSVINAYTDKNGFAGFFQIAGSLADALDGPVARSGGGSKNGDLNDVAADKSGEAAVFWGHAKSAETKLGRFAALAALSTCILPSLIRATAESTGYYVPEDGGSKLALLGTRAGRCILGIAGTLSPKLQPLTDSISAASNIYACFGRIKGMKKIDNPESDLKDIGIKKLPILAAGVALTGALALHMAKSENKNYGFGAPLG